MEQNNYIFNYIKPYENIMFSKLKKTDLDELLHYINNYYLELRNELKLDKNITIGLEIEFENVKIKKEELEKELEKTVNKKLNSWIVKTEPSLSYGLEINSPILIDEPHSWYELKKVCDIINKVAIIGRNSGAHIHIGSQILEHNIDYYLNFAKLWSIYENIIFRFSYGEYLSGRPNIKEHSKVVANILYDKYITISKNKNPDLYRFWNLARFSKNYCINLDNIGITDQLREKDTIEIRCPNGTLNEVIWQNNVNFFVHFLEYSKNNNFNHEIIDRRRLENLKLGIYENLKLYDEIFLEQAIELADLIFDRNIEKIYFLRQYLKSFEVENKPMVLAKKFTTNKKY